MSKLKKLIQHVKELSFSVENYREILEFDKYYSLSGRSGKCMYIKTCPITGTVTIPAYSYVDALTINSFCKLASHNPNSTPDSLVG